MYNLVHLYLMLIKMMKTLKLRECRSADSSLRFNKNKNSLVPIHIISATIATPNVL